MRTEGTKVKIQHDPGTLNRMLTLVLVFLVLVPMLLHFGSFTTLTGQSYVVLRYAQSLVKGHGFSLNPDEHYQGFTNPVWVCLCALPTLIMNDPSVGMRCLACFWAMLAGLLLLRLAAKLPGARNPVLLALPSLLLVSNPTFIGSTRQGDDSALVTAVMLVVIGRLIVEWQASGPERYPLSALLLSLVGIMRIEGVLFIAVGALLCCHKYRRGVVTSSYLVRWFHHAAIPLGLFWLWKLVYFGGIIPGPLAAQLQSNGFPRLDHGIDYLWSFLKRSNLWALGPIGVVLAARRNLSSPYLLGWGLIAVHILLIISVGGEWAPNHALAVPLLPLFFLGLVGGIAAIAHQFPAQKKMVSISFSALVLGLNLFGNLAWTDSRSSLLSQFEALTHPSGWRSQITRWTRISERQPEVLVGAWMESWLPDKDIVALGAPDPLIYYLDNSILMLNGSTSPQIAKLKTLADLPTALAEYLVLDTATKFLVFRFVRQGPTDPLRFASDLEESLYANELIPMLYQLRYVVAIQGDRPRTEVYYAILERSVTYWFKDKPPVYGTPEEFLSSVPLLFTLKTDCPG